MHRQVIQSGCDSAAPSGDRCGSYSKCSTKGARGRGAGGSVPRLQVEVDGSS